MSWARRCSVLIAPVAAIALVGCTTGSGGDGDDSPTTSPRTDAAVCAGQNLPTTTDGRLTLATYSPTYAPWFVTDDPGNGQGFESALGFRIAQQMGFKPSEVTWVRADFGAIVGGTPGEYDLALAQVSMTPARAKVVDFTTPYATVSQAVLTYEDSPIAAATTLAALRTASFAASAQTTSAASVSHRIGGKATVRSFPSIKDAGAALTGKQVDGLVADLPTASYLADSVLDDSVLLGEISNTSEQVAGVLRKGSPIKSCVNQALGKLRDDGTLETLRKEWLTTKPKAAPIVLE